MLVMRFSNHFMAAVWSREHIDNIQVVMKEGFGTQGRGGYFDKFGVIRDVVQNHLLQVSPPASPLPNSHSISMPAFNVHSVGRLLHT
jgi:glucose-6-phosphate 1-dehydrogenase